MQYLRSTALPYKAHLPMRPVPTFLLLAALGALVMVVQGLALLIPVALGLVLGLAIYERVRKLRANPPAAPPIGGHRVNDGGSFPGNAPELERAIQYRACVLDGGSLGPHRR